jgi:hypothetical protein
VVQEKESVAHFLITAQGKISKLKVLGQ